MGLTKRVNKFYNSMRDFAARRAVRATGQRDNDTNDEEESDDDLHADLVIEQTPTGDPDTGPSRSTDQDTSSRTTSDLFNAMGRLELHVAHMSNRQTQMERQLERITDQQQILIEQQRQILSFLQQLSRVLPPQQPQ